MNDPEGSCDLLGPDVSPGSHDGGGGAPPEEKVPVNCLTDPGDPDCEGPLGCTRTEGGGLEFGEECGRRVCGRRMCSGRGEHVLDPDGAVACEREEGVKGPNCDKAPLE